MSIFHPFRRLDEEVRRRNVRYEAKFHRTVGPHQPDEDWTWLVRKIVISASVVTIFDARTAPSYVSAKNAAELFIEHQRILDETPWEEL